MAEKEYDAIVLRSNENGEWERYEPYATIDCLTEEDYNLIVKAVEEYKKGKQSGWISAENPPEKYMEKTDFIDFIICCEGEVYPATYDGKYWGDDCGRFSNVTHWMPMPDPPKGD